MEKDFLNRIPDIVDNHKRVCFVIQRYGEKVNGGAELLCRELAERLTPYYDVEVLTTKAIDYITWKDEYTDSFEIINDVKVHRFSVRKERHLWWFNKINWFCVRGILPAFLEELWLKMQGPYVPELLDYIRNHKNDFDVFVFVTYLYYPTVMGIREVAEKSVLLPLAHNEPFLDLGIIRPIFSMAKGLFYETREEYELVCKKYGELTADYSFGGAGVDLPEVVDADRFYQKYGINNYIIYVGRIDRWKNCEELFDFFRRYKEENPGDLTLLLLGKSVIDIPKSEDIISLGFVSEEDKFDAIKGANALVLPSKFESLSIVVLEAFSLGRPVIVNKACDVLKGHVDRSGGGYAYSDYADFRVGLERLLRDKELSASMGDNGRKYVEKYFTWDVIISNLRGLIETVC